jgi:hypothetical protein
MVSAATRHLPWILPRCRGRVPLPTSSVSLLSGGLDIHLPKNVPE